MRLIPKNSKVKTSIWKGFTLIDVIIASVAFALVLVILMSNIPNNWYLVFVVVILTFLLLIGSEGSRVYHDLGYIAKYLVQKKRFTKAAQKKAGLVDELIPWKEIAEDGTLVFTAGYFAKVIEIEPVEFGLMSEFEQDLKISRFAGALNILTETQSLELVKIDRPINYDTYAETLIAQIEREKSKSEGEQDKDKIEILTVRLAQIQNLNTDDKTYKPFFYFVLLDNNESTLQSTVRTFVNILEGSIELPTVRVLNAAETATFLKYGYNRDFDERDVKDVAREDLIEYVKPKEINFNWLGYEVDGRKAATYVVADYPLTVGNAWGAGLFSIPNTKVVLRIKTVAPVNAIKRIDRTYVELLTRNGTDKASRQIDKEVHIETMGELLKSLQMDSERLFDCTLTVTGYDNDGGKLSDVMKKIRQQITSNGLMPNILRCRQLDGFIASSVTRRNALANYERGINSESLAAIFPFAQSILLDKNGYTLGANGSLPVIVDFWKRGGKFTNSNITIIGQSGGGKSYFMKFLISLLYSDNSKIFVLDPENEYAKLCKSVGGTFIDVGSSDSGIINPFHIYDVLTENGDRADNSVIYYAHLRFLEQFFKTILSGVHKDTLEVINNIVVDCYAERGISEFTNVNTLKPNDFPTFDDLLTLTKKRLETSKNTLETQNLQRAEQYLAKFATGGRLANLWNGASTLSSASRFTVFNFQSLFATKNDDVARAQMLLVTKFIAQEIINIREQNRNVSAEDEMHPILFFDEGYQFIDEDNPIALDFVYEQYKKIRKYSGMAGFITQNISDFNKSNVAGKTTAILKNTQYHFIFPLREGDVQDLVELYSGASELNEVEQYEIANNGRGRCFLISHAKSRLCFDIIAPDVLVEKFD